MKNPLLRSVIVVALTWWVILTIQGGAVLDTFASVWKILTVMAVATSGLVTVYLTMYVGRALVARNLAGISSRGLSVSMGGIPSGLGEPPRIRGASLLPSDSRLYNWLHDARDVHPNHADLFEACIQVYAKHRDLPASPIPGGHGGLSLMDHALHVAEVTLEMAESWVYDGGRDKKGRLRVPLIDPEYVFDRNDPLIPVLAIAHDIGKIECYTRNDEGVLIEYRHDHDMVSGLTLSRMPETWRLPANDRKALFYAVSHYHHPVDLPMHVDDRTRAVMELLIAADVEASTREGDPNRAKAWKKLTEEPTEDEVLWEAFCDLIAAPAAINGNDKVNRLGYKYGNFVYLSEERVRYALAEAMNTPSAAERRSRMGDGRYKISERLMTAMLERGLLYNTHDGREYGVARALFRVVFMDPRNPDFKVEMPAVIIMKPGNEFQHLNALSDSRLVPTTVTPLYSERSAKHKQLADGPNPATNASPQQDQADQAQQSPTAGADSSHESADMQTKHASPLELLQRLRAEQERASKKRETRLKKDIAQPLHDMRVHILRVAGKILSFGAGGDVRYHVDDKKGLTYLLITEEIAKQIGDTGMEWLRNSEDKRLRIRAGDAAEYLVVGNEYVHMDDRS